MQNLTKPVIFRNESLNIELSGMLYEGKPVFFAVEVAKALGYERPQDALAQHYKLLIKINLCEMQCLGLEPKPNGISLLTESNMYRQPAKFCKLAPQYLLTISV